jgi:four helix bundle protein
VVSSRNEGGHVADFKRLKVWHASPALSVMVYTLARTLPRDELYGLRSQMTRAGGSIAANIAEGVGRAGDAELARFLDIGMGSATELECHVLRARDLNFVSQKAAAEFLIRLDEVQKMMAGLKRRVRMRLDRTSQPRT